MLAQLLNREFLTKSLENLKNNMPAEAAKQKKGDQDALARHQQTGVDAQELDDASNYLSALLNNLTTSAGAAEDDQAFLPRDAALSIIQSALQKFFEERDMIRTSEAKGALEIEFPVTDEELKDTGLTAEDAKGLFEKFSMTDIGWASVKVAEAIRAIRGRREFNKNAAAPIKIANRARLLLMGDWGSGIPRARKVGAQMRAVLEEGNTKGLQQHVIHLGDVYYSGYEDEYKKHFLPYWPVQPGEENKYYSWALNANHDMYSGGYGYYNYLLKDARFGSQQQSSFFSLENDYWQILGLDTGYQEDDLKPEQLPWINNMRNSAKNKKGMLLSHHQPFSAFESASANLLPKLNSVLKENLVNSWFWGHEHRCALYQPQHNVKHGRCVGHGGIPVYASSSPLPDGVLYEYQGMFKSGLEKWALFGFAVLDFEDGKIAVRYINEKGEEHFQETLE